MKNKKTYLVIFILILYFSFVFQGNNTIFNGQDYRNYRNIKIKLSASISHEYEWYRIWGGGLSDSGGRVAVDSLGNVYLAGSTESFGVGFSDMVLVKYDNAGVQQWDRTWGGADYDYGTDVTVDSTNNIYLVGSTFSFTAGGSDIVLVKYDSSGVQQWNRTWGGIDDDEGYGVAVDSSGNVFISGYTESFGVEFSDMVLVKYDSAGVQQWNRTWDGAGRGTALALDSLGNIFIAGDTNFGAGLTDICLVKYNSAGVLQWNTTWGGSNWDYGIGVAVDSSDRVYVSGRTRSFGAGDSDMVLVKYDIFGVQQWNRTWGGISTDYGGRVAVDSSDNVYFAGTTVGFGAGLFDMTLVKYNTFGEQQWYRTWGGGSSDWGIGVALDSSKNVYVGGMTASFGAGIDDFALVKYSKIPEVIINSPHQNELFGSVAPTFNISILEPSLDSTWYTLDDGITNITFSGLTGTIEQIEWDKKGSGWITITFWANNTLSKEGNAEVTVFKDTDNPEITINSPIQGDKIGEIAPNYDISIVEPNLELIWYTIDGGITNYTITQLSGTIGQSAWDIAPYNNIAIRFYANDLLGNIGYKEVVVEKVEEVKDGGPAIFGYNLLLIISLIGLITAIILKRKFN